MSRRGTTNHLPWPACLVNTSQVRSLISMALLCRHLTQPPPDKGDRSVFTERLSQKGVSSKEPESDCCSPTDPGVNKNAQTLQLYVLFPNFQPWRPRTSNMLPGRGSCVGVSLPPTLPIGLNRAFPRPFPLPRLVSSHPRCARRCFQEIVVPLIIAAWGRAGRKQAAQKVGINSSPLGYRRHSQLTKATEMLG